MMCHDKRDSRAVSVMRFWRRENFLRFDIWEIQGLTPTNGWPSSPAWRETRGAPRNRDHGGWSWKLVRSRGFQRWGSRVKVVSAYTTMMNDNAVELSTFTRK
nr:hypothetical protein Iba_chr09cCG5560 [Ipomoea batatas]